MSLPNRVSILARCPYLVLIGIFIVSHILLVQSSPEPDTNSKSPPRIITHPKNVTAIEKSTAIFICEAEGNPKPTVEWSKHGEVVHGRKRFSITKIARGLVIRIDHLKLGRDDGIYECRATSEFGSAVSSQIEVRIVNETEAGSGFPQLISQPPSRQTVEIGGTATFQCKASADPLPEYTWFHDSKPIKIFDTNDTTIQEGGTLKIQSVADHHRGEYICLVENLKGSITSKSSTLSISLEPRLENAPLELKYRLTSPTDVTITWSPPETKSNVTIVGYEIQFGIYGATSFSKHDTNFTRFAFNDLSDNTQYAFRVRAKSRASSGAWSETIKFITPKDSPPAPPNVKALADSYSSAMIWWDEVAHFEGIVGYRVYYNRLSAQPTLGSNEDLDLWLIKNVSLTNSVIISNLAEEASYEVRVCAVGNDFSGKLSNSVRFRAIPEEVPYDLRTSDLTTHSVKVLWKPPLEMVPSEYKVVYSAPEKHFMDDQGLKQVITIPPTTMSTNNTSIDLGELIPYTRYRINVTAVPSKEAFRPPATIHITTAIAAPKQMNEPNLLGPSSSGKEFELRLPLASEEFGPIGHYYVVVIPSEMPSLDPDSYLTSDLIATAKSSGSGPYITAKFSKARMTRRFMLGDRLYYEGFHNRELVKDQQYYVFVRAVVEHSESLYSSSRTAGPINLSQPKYETLPVMTRDNDRKVKWFLIGSLAMVMILAIVVTLFYKTQRKALKTNQINETSISLLQNQPTVDIIYGSVPAEPADKRNMPYQSRAMMNQPIPVNRLAEHIEYLKTNNKLKEEYESIEPGQQFTWENSYMTYNRPKNRYGNVVAYDHSRVVLSQIDNVPGSDYINANFCNGYNKPNHYIATQGPLPNTVGDFWRMVWERNSRTLVMMTQLEERGRVKCVQYWPTKGSITYYGITVIACGVEELAYYSIRTFKLQVNQHVREVRQFQFTAWPDHGVPHHPAPFLMFLRRIKVSNPTDAGPMIVLCSAGVGRTGCFIVIDSMIERIKQEKTIDIYGHVTSLRAQRNYIVQTEDQYMFIHDAILETIISSDTEISDVKLEEHFYKLMQVVTNEGTTGLELEFKRLANIKHSGQKFISANLPVNRHKNRLMNILPYESTRVCLEPIAGIEGSDYINASFCDSYRQRNAYIATQSPVPDTVDDFWRMLVEHNSGIVVMLTKLKEMGREKCTQFWPAERYGDYGPYRVNFNPENQEFNTENYVLREFSIADSRNPNYNGLIRLFHYTNWPEQGVPKSGEEFIKFIAEVHSTKQTLGIEGPITVLCSVGVGRTGAFIALSIIIERLLNERLLNIFETVRTMRTQRPGMIQTEDQYQFCYQTALEYIKSF